MQVILTVAVDGSIILSFCLFLPSTWQRNDLKRLQFPSQGKQGPPGNFPGLSAAGTFSGKAARGGC